MPGDPSSFPSSSEQEEALNAPELRALVEAWPQLSPDVHRSIREATATYEGASDPFQEFIDERCVLEAGAWESNGTLFTALESFLHERRARTFSRVAMGDRFTRLGFNKANGKMDGASVRGRKGIRLRPDPNAEEAGSRG